MNILATANADFIGSYFAFYWYSTEAFGSSIGKDEFLAAWFKDALHR